MSLMIYAQGPLSMSVCTDYASRKAIVAQANKVNPTGIESGWTIAKDKTFATGEPNPCDCEQQSDNKHYLLHC